MKVFGIRLIEFFKPKNWFSWLRGTIIGHDLKQEYIEQVMFRMTNPNCRVCVKQGYCKEPCRCKTFQKMLDPLAECPGKNEEGEPYWGEMLSPSQWNRHKEFSGLEFKATYNKVKEPDIGGNIKEGA